MSKKIKMSFLFAVLLLLASPLFQASAEVGVTKKAF